MSLPRRPQHISLQHPQPRIPRQHNTAPQKPQQQAEIRQPHDAIVYDTSHGYPKGLAKGPQTVITDKKGRRKVVYGIPWERLDKETQKDLDEHPLDDAGQLRIYIKDSFGGEGSYIEFGSEAHAAKLLSRLEEAGDRLAPLIKKPLIKK